MAAEAEMYLHLTVDTTRETVPARALWIAAPLSEKQTVQSVLFPEGICYRKDIGFFAPVTNALEAVVFKMSFGTCRPRRSIRSLGWWAWVDLNHRPRPYQGLLWCYMHSSVG